jgi:hypothetical protein
MIMRTILMSAKSSQSEHLGGSAFGGKKLFFAAAAVALLAAGCNGSQTASIDTQTQMESQTGGMQSMGSTQTQAQSNVQVNGVDDAVNILLTNSTNEQSKTTAGDDSDLSSSDSAELNGFMEASNGY